MYPEQDPSKANPIDVDEWLFFVLTTSAIEDHFGDQKSVALSRIQALTDPVSFAQLRKAVEAALAISGAT